MNKKSFLKNSLIQQWIYFIAALFFVLILVILITPRRNVYIDETKKNDQSILHKVECRCLGLKDSLNELPPDAPYYEERCMGIIGFCKEKQIQLQPKLPDSNKTE